MNDRIVLSLREVRSGDSMLVGGKGANLGELVASGFPVPSGFVVTTTAFRQFFDSLELHEETARAEAASREGLPAACARIRERIVSGEIATEVADEILSAYSRLIANDERMRSAVRSSATAEDLEEASFAGQHGTYYYVDAAHLLEMIRHCWASLWSAEAAAYRATRGIRSVAMAVVVQQMIRSEVSGVSFTVNPISGDRGEIIIESTWGMGAALVDGRVTPDRYVVTRDGLKMRQRRIAEKRVMIPADLPSSERLVDVPQDMRYLETLAPQQIEEVAALSLRCEEHFGSPQDVEWALAGDQIHLLQSRPVTTLRRQEIAPPPGKWVLFKAVAENFTEPVTPMTIDLVTRGAPPTGIRAIGGRIYMSIKPLQMLLPFDLSDEEVANLLYLEDLPKRARLQLLKLPLTIAAMTMIWLTFGVLLARTRGMPGDFMDGYRALCRDVLNDRRLGPLAAMERLLSIPRFFDPVGWMALPVNGSAAARAPMWVGIVRMMVRRWAPDAGADAVAVLCSGSEGVLSAQMGRDLGALAEVARNEPVVAELLVRSSPEKVVGRLREEPAARAFLTQLDSFLAKHGHRAVKELDLQTPRWEENPAPVLAMVRNSVVESAIAPRAMHRQVEETRQELESRLRHSLGWRWPLLHGAAKRAREFLKMRENSRFYHIMGFGIVRKKMLAIEEELLGNGKLKCRDDIFFLLWSEVRALRSGAMGWLDVEERIRERRMERVRLAKLTPPRTFGIEVASDSSALTDSPDVLRGQGASPGRCEGIARVILDPSADANLRPGEVLVAPYTDPAWTPLFLTAGAAVVEVGSYLSHAGTVAREYGMPCVVDVAGCTRRIQSGTRIEVDGDRGTVRILGSDPA